LFFLYAAMRKPPRALRFALHDLARRARKECLITIAEITRRRPKAGR
jgi:hypothetical protein